MDTPSLRLVVDFAVWFPRWIFRWIFFGPFSLEKQAGKIY